MTHYDYKVVPAPKRAKRVKGLHAPEELFAATLAEAINEVARQGWEYVRAETLHARVAGRLVPAGGGVRRVGADLPARARERRPAADGGQGRAAGAARARRPSARSSTGCSRRWRAASRACGASRAWMPRTRRRRAAPRGPARTRPRRRCARRRGWDRPRSPDQALPARSSASACTPPASSSASARCTARLRSSAAEPIEGGRPHGDAEVRRAALAPASVAAVLLALVHHLEMLGRKGGGELGAQRLGGDAGGHPLAPADGLWAVAAID